MVLVTDLMKPHKWQLEIKKRHLQILFMDLGLIITVLAFTSFVIVKEVIIKDLSTDLDTMKKLSAQPEVLSEFIKCNETRHIAVLQNDTILKSEGFNLSERLRKKLVSSGEPEGVKYALINGDPKVFVLRKDSEISMLISRKAPQGWFYIFMSFLVAFLFVFFHIQRLVGYKFLFSPALSEVQFHEKLNKAKETFFASIFHELGTPLTSLMSRLELLMETNKDTSIGKSIENAYLEAQRISFLSSEQLHRARFEMGAEKLNPEKIHPADLLDSISFRLEILINHHHKRLVVENEGQQHVFWGDRLKLEQALINLITNAIKYAPDTQDIYLRSRQMNQETQLEVQDLGAGIPVDKIDHLLQPFHMGNQDPHKMPSTGLGLYLVNQIARVHQGHVSFHQYRPGFAVCIHLPGHLFPPEVTSGHGTNS